MRNLFFISFIIFTFILGCTSEKEVQPKNFSLPKNTVAILKINEKTIAKELFWQSIKSGQWDIFFHKNTDQLFEFIKNKSDYGLAEDFPLYLFIYLQNDSTYKPGFIFAIKDSVKLNSSGLIENNQLKLASHLGEISSNFLYLFLNTDSINHHPVLPFTDSIPEWTNQYSITGLINQVTPCSQLGKTYLGIQMEDNFMRINFSQNVSLNKPINTITLPEGIYFNSTIQPIKNIDSCFFRQYENKLINFFPNTEDRNALFNTSLKIHLLGWDTITTKEYQTTVNEEFETVLTPVYKSHSYPLLKIETIKDSLSDRLLLWASHQKIIKKQNKTKYMCVLGVQKSFVFVTDSNVIYLPEKFVQPLPILNELVFSYQPDSFKGGSLLKNNNQQLYHWNQWASEHLSSLSIIQNEKNYQLALQFKSNDFPLLSFFKMLQSAQQKISAHNLEKP